MMERCTACERLLDFYRQAPDKVAVMVRGKMLQNHQQTNCVNRDWFTGRVRVAKALPVQTKATQGSAPTYTPPEVESITLEFSGVWPGGKPVYIVHREAA